MCENIWKSCQKQDEKWVGPRIVKNVVSSSTITASAGCFEESLPLKMP